MSVPHFARIPTNFAEKATTLTRKFLGDEEDLGQQFAAEVNKAMLAREKVTVFQEAQTEEHRLLQLQGWRNLRELDSRLKSLLVMCSVKRGEVKCLQHLVKIDPSILTSIKDDLFAESPSLEMDICLLENRATLYKYNFYRHLVEDEDLLGRFFSALAKASGKDENELKFRYLRCSSSELNYNLCRLLIALGTNPKRCKYSPHGMPLWDLIYNRPKQGDEQKFIDTILLFLDHGVDADTNVLFGSCRITSLTDYFKAQIVEAKSDVIKQLWREGLSKFYVDTVAVSEPDPSPPKEKKPPFFPSKNKIIPL